MSNQPNKTNGAKPAVRKKKNLLDDRRIRLALSVLGAIVACIIDDCSFLVVPLRGHDGFPARKRSFLYGDTCVSLRGNCRFFT